MSALACKYVITIESETPPPIILGNMLAGGTVTELRVEKPALVSASQLAMRYGLSTETIRQKLAAIAQGSGSKCLYDPVAAHELLTSRKVRVGAKRKN